MSFTRTEGGGLLGMGTDSWFQISQEAETEVLSLTETQHAFAKNNTFWMEACQAPINSIKMPGLVITC